MSTDALKFDTVDVFTTSRFVGNQLAVVHVPSNATLERNTKLAIAKEFALSETDFLHAPVAPNEWPIDIFTVAEELPFAGHPLVGAACLLGMQNQSLTRGKLLCKAGPVPFTIEREGGRVSASVTIPHGLHVHANRFSTDSLVAFQPRLSQTFSSSLKEGGSPVISITSGGPTFVLIPVPSMDALGAVEAAFTSPSVDLDERYRGTFVGAYFYFCKTSSTSTTGDGGSCIDVHTRMVGFELGEDAVTGSAACTLAAYLARQAFLDHGRRELTVNVTQGEHMGRPGSPKLRVSIKEDGHVDTIVMTGQSVLVMDGNLRFR